MRKWHRIAQGMVVSWTLLTATLLLGISVGILAQPGFPLALGPVRTTGLTGLWVTLFPAVLAFAGVVLLKLLGRLAAGLLVTYSAFWAAVVASGLPVVWNAKTSFCLNGLGVCITSPWLGRLATMTLSAAFLLASVWFWRFVVAREGPRGANP